MTSRPRVLLVAASTSTSGGGEKHIADILRSQAELGVDLGLACPEGGDLPELAISLGVPVFLASTAGMGLAGVRELRRAIRDFGPSIVHAHGSRAAFYARLADPRAAQRVLYTVHGIHIDKAGSFLRKRSFLALERALRGRTARFIAVCASDFSKGARLGVLDPARSDVVYNGIELPVPTARPGEFRAELGIGDDAPLLLCVGRYHEQKDHLTLLDAFARVGTEWPEAVLALVGSGALEADLRVHATALALGDSVRFVPPRPVLAAAYGDADALVLPSLWEGLPYVVVEAMAYGLPVVATAVDGVPEAVTDGISGKLVPPSDVDALASAVLSVLADPVAACAMGEAGRVLVEERFGLDRMVRELAGIYSDMSITANDETVR